ncbi:DJ-1/PfpI family protein [Bernardetia sp. Wsw4-3y2]|uniref:DJ-1/PfpI family protein n=1 Tax=Bernardetia sp. Wsw4-3y2 TaxID=3127471 RepID=UPI0030D09C3B
MGTCEHCGMMLIKKSELSYEKKENMKIAFYLQDGVEVLDFAGPMEVFAYAGFDVFTVSETKEPIVSQGILKIVPQYSIQNSPKADILAFFGGNSEAAFSDEVVKWIKAQQDIQYHFSVCTGAFALAKADILDDQTATTFHNALNRLETDFPKIQVVKSVRFVDNGKVISTAGISAGIDGALHVVAKIKGFNTARRIAYHMEYDKWIPQEGLLLSENPYKGYIDINYINDYTGIYEYTNGKSIQLYVDSKDSSLYARLDSQDYPLFYIERDVFTDLNEDTVKFMRDDKGIITDYKIGDSVSEYFKKLN